MVSARYASLGTIAADGRSQARLIDPLSPDAEFNIYFATNPKSRKVAEIGKDARVSLLYFDSHRMAYVTVIGRASLENEDAKASRHKPEWQPFFPKDKPATYALFRVAPERLEVVSARDGLAGDTATWLPEIISFR